jgi:hypothetical protein
MHLARSYLKKIMPVWYAAFGFTCISFLSSPFASAHHSHASLDRNNIQQHRGVVTKYSWRMPHVFISVEAPNLEGQVVEYNIEMLHPPGMKEKGWSSDSLKPGDIIIWEGPADKNPNRYYSGLNWAEKSDGTRLTMTTTDVAKVEPSIDLTGVWVRDTPKFGFTYRPIPDWPYTDFAQAQVDNFSELQNPQLDCLNPGPPKSTTLPYPIKILRPDNDTVILDYEGADHVRTIPLSTEFVAGEPSQLGSSRARFEGDVLVVETSNFIADRWGSYTGVDSSEQKHLVERFSLIDDGLGLRVEMTLSDPIMLKAPVTIDYYMKKLADRELVKIECTVENSRLYIEAGN